MFLEEVKEERDGVRKRRPMYSIERVSVRDEWKKKEMLLDNGEAERDVGEKQ